MDEQSVRSQLLEVRKTLARNEEEHEILLSLLNGFEGWLRLHANGRSPQLTLPLETTQARTAPRGEISLRSAVLQVLKEARGQPLHSKEILVRATALGAATTSKDPVAIVDLTAYSLQKGGATIEKTGPRIWHWAGPSGSQPLKGEQEVELGGKGA